MQFFHYLKKRFIVTRTRRNGLQIDHEGYSYTKRSESDGTIAFRCKKRNGCRGTATANSLLTRFVPIQPHNHLPSNDDLLIARKSAEFKQIVSSQPLVPIPTLYKNFLLSFSENEQAARLRFPEFQ